MRRVEILTTCDACLAWKGREVAEGVETVSVIGEHTLDLCAEHRDGMRAVLGLVAEFADGAAVGRAAQPRMSKARREAAEAEVDAALAGTRNRRGGKRARARRANAEAATVAEGGEISCPRCEFTAANRRGLGIHARLGHGIEGGVAALLASA